MNRWWVTALGLALAWFAMAPPGPAAEKKAEKKAPPNKSAVVKKEAADTRADAKAQITAPVVVKMEEVPAFTKEGITGMRSRYPRGPVAPCTRERSKEVKAYPKLKSKQPVFGSVLFDGNPSDPAAGKKFFFVLDQSGTEEKPAEKGKAKESPKKKPAAEVEERVAMPRMVQPKYDRLYFDCNGDLDLTNDGVLKIAEKAPFEGVPKELLGTVFEDLAVLFDYGPPVGKRPFLLVPRLRGTSGEVVFVDFLPKFARKGTVRLGKQEFSAWLSQSRMISGRFDRPLVELELTPVSGPVRYSLVRPGTLGETRVIGGQFISASASPLGDELTIGPYRGDLGVLEIGSGGRTLTELGIAGSLVSRTGAMPMDEMFPPPETLSRRHKLPVGDYQVGSVLAQVGRLRFNARLSVQPTPTSESGKSPAFPVAIRKDKPYVLEFSGKPEVVFMNPSKDSSFKPGTAVMIRAMLTEPWQGLQITGLYDTTQKKGTAEYRVGDEKIRVTEYARLDPSIVIKNSLGEEMASGKMPFG